MSAILTQIFQWVQTLCLHKIYVGARFVLLFFSSLIFCLCLFLSLSFSHSLSLSLSKCYVSKRCVIFRYFTLFYRCMCIFFSTLLTLLASYLFHSLAHSFIHPFIHVSKKKNRAKTQLIDWNTRTSNTTYRTKWMLIANMEWDKNMKESMEKNEIVTKCMYKRQPYRLQCWNIKCKRNLSFGFLCVCESILSMCMRIRTCATCITSLMKEKQPC